MLFRCVICALVLFCGGWLYAGEVLDRIVATVNRHIILQSDLDEELRYESLTSGRDLQTADERKAALNRLVDRELIGEQASTTEYEQTTADEIDAQLERVKSDYVNTVKTSWSAGVAKYGFTEKEIRDRIALELSQWKIIDARLRPTIQVDQPAIEGYYKRQFLPELTRSGAQPIPLAEAAAKIHEILIQQKINEALPQWLETLRSQAQIRIVGSNSSSSDQPQ